MEWEGRQPCCADSRRRGLRSMGRKRRAQRILRPMLKSASSSWIMCSLDRFGLPGVFSSIVSIATCQRVGENPN